MFNNKIRSLTVAAGLVATLAMTGSGVASAHSLVVGPVSPTDGPTVASVTVASGTNALTITAPNVLTFSNVTLTGSAQNPGLDTSGIVGSGKEPFTIGVSDLTGLGKGWSVTLNPTVFTGAVSTKTLATSSLTVPTAPVVTPGTGTAPVLTTAMNTAYTGGALTIPTGASTPIFTTNTNTGMGTSSLNVPLRIAIPLDTIADTYSSSITVAVTTLV